MSILVAPLKPVRHSDENSLYIVSPDSTLLYTVSNHRLTFSLFERLSDSRNLVFILFWSHIPHQLKLPKIEIPGVCDTILTPPGEIARIALNAAVNLRCFYSGPEISIFLSERKR